MNRLDKAISDVAFILDNLILLRQIQSTGDCNICRNKGNGCLYEPKPGQMVRYNCPFSRQKVRCGMQIVIDIPKYVYDTIVANEGYIADCDNEKVGMAIKNGTPLPKGHGRLIDADDIDNHIIGHVDTRSCPTIIESDKEVENG